MFGLTALPESPGKLVGWSRELAELGRALSSARLLTLVGPGGVGKTTLAVELARRAKRRAGARTWFLDLSSLSDGGQLAGAADLARETGDEPWLLVVDNCEHLVDAAAGLAGSLLERCRRLRLVATSRERLGVRGEVVWAVPPLAPDEAVALFLVHGRAAAGGLQEEAFERTAIERLCRELEGIPLAIELATARTALLSTAEILARLDDRFALLKAGPRSAPWRQRTLAALCYRWDGHRVRLYFHLRPDSYNDAQPDRCSCSGMASTAITARSCRRSLPPSVAGSKSNACPPTLPISTRQRACKPTSKDASSPTDAISRSATP